MFSNPGLTNTEVLIRCAQLWAAVKVHTAQHFSDNDHHQDEGNNPARKTPKSAGNPAWNSEIYSRQHTFRVLGRGQSPFLKCFTGSNSRSKNISISSGWVPARNLRTMAMRVPEADFPWVLLPVLFFIRPYKTLKVKKHYFVCTLNWKHNTSWFVFLEGEEKKLKRFKWIYYKTRKSETEIRYLT